MPRTILLDANVLIQINQGNKEAAIKLRNLLKGGHRVWISRQASWELTENPKLLPQTQKAQSLMLQELRIPVAPSGSQKDRQQFIMQNAPSKGGLSDKGDVHVAAQAIANNAEIWSFDRTFRKNHQQLSRELGIKVAPESHQVPRVDGTADYRVGRNLLGLAPIKIDAHGKVTTKGPWKPPRQVLSPTPKPGGGTGGGASQNGSKSTRAIVGVPLKPVVVGGPSAQAGKVEGGMTIYLQGVGLVLNIITDQINKGRIDKALAERERDIAKYQTEHPHEGTLIVLSFERITPHPEAMVTPKPVFSFLRIYHGRTLAMAKQRWVNTPEISKAPVGDKTIVTELIWIDPIDPKPIKVENLKLPFPRTAVASFVFKKGKGFTFRDAEWGGATGFDDSGVTVIGEGGDDAIPDSWTDFLQNLTDHTLQFYVLKPPKKIEWFWAGRWNDAEISTINRKTSNGVLLNVVDMDPSLPFDTAAALVFPATENSKELFSLTPEIKDRLHLLRSVPNAHLLRFIEPQHLRVVRKI